jgi:1-acyl-sn-glycerol-3-phosphate acyltransferase
MTAAAAFAHRCCGPSLLRFFRAEVTGRGHVPRNGGVLLAVNHRSFLDHFLLAAASPRPLLFLGKSELGRGVGGRINLAFGMVPVERGTGDASALGLVGDLLTGGSAVAIFPEGTRSPTEELFRFRSGIARLAAASQVPVVPVGLVGTEVVWPRGQNPVKQRPPRSLLQVHFGPVLAPPDANARTRRAFTETLHETVAGLSGQPRADRFAPIAR